MQAQGRQPGVGRTTSLSACKRSRAVKPAIASKWDEAHLSVLNVRASSSPRFVRKLKKSATHETFNRDPTRFWNSSTSRCQQTCLRNRNAAGRENMVMLALVAQVPRTYLRPQSRHFSPRNFPRKLSGTQTPRTQVQPGFNVWGVGAPCLEPKSTYE